MTSDGVPRRRRHPSWDLLWTVPVAAVLSVLPIGWASLSWCGVWGCSQGARRGDAGSIILPVLVVGALVGAAVVIVPWTEQCALRALVSMGVGLAAAVCAGVYVLDL
ncbi:hypothetical protein MHY85_10590 [Cellulomonas sp. ACRRI]|uniref:hypothetical protein n=1 Tax=Cellulomonas sp. ACRRI TaxID=2918188 RepID=UPI001EF31C74|nr:hypothetical protein [Cellulomonas sp. ACRRI]MCG7286416.1 hypothetical protein [Cellulomonas sp. ACRRI]